MDDLTKKDLENLDKLYRSFIVTFSQDTIKAVYLASGRDYRETRNFLMVQSNSIYGIARCK